MLQKKSLNLRLKKIDETRNYLLEKIRHNGLRREKNKKVCSALSYFEKHFLVLVSAVTGCVSISTFVLLVVVPLGINVLICKSLN